MSNEKEIQGFLDTNLQVFFEQEAESIEMPANLAMGVISAIEAGKKMREARLMTASIAAIVILAIVLSVSYLNLESLGVIAAMIMGAFAWFFTVAEIRRKREIYYFMS